MPSAMEAPPPPTGQHLQDCNTMVIPLKVPPKTSIPICGNPPRNKALRTKGVHLGCPHSVQYGHEASRAQQTLNLKPP